MPHHRDRSSTRLAFYLIPPYSVALTVFGIHQMLHKQSFAAHITLAFRDFQTEIQAHVLDYLREAPLPSERFLAQNFHLLEFSSLDWEGSWEQTLTWHLLKSWQV